MELIAGYVVVGVLGYVCTSIYSKLNAALEPYGVEVSMVNLQNITFTDEVEDSIKNVEVAQQKQAEAEANLKATEVSAQAKVIEAEANRKLSE